MKTTTNDTLYKKETYPLPFNLSEHVKKGYVPAFSLITLLSNNGWKTEKHTMQTSILDLKKGSRRIVDAAIDTESLIIYTV